MFIVHTCCNDILTLTKLKYFCMETKVFFQFEIIINVFMNSFYSFEYLFYGSMVLWQLYLTYISTDGPRAERVNTSFIISDVTVIKSK